MDHHLTNLRFGNKGEHLLDRRTEQDFTETVLRLSHNPPMRGAHADADFELQTTKKPHHRLHFQPGSERSERRWNIGALRKLVVIEPRNETIASKADHTAAVMENLSSDGFKHPANSALNLFRGTVRAILDHKLRGN